MPIVADFRTLSSEVDTHEATLSLLFYKKSVEWILCTLEELLEKVKKIENPIKRNKLQQRYYKLKEEMERIEDGSKLVSSLFFIQEKIFEYPLSPRERQVMEEYKIRDYHLYAESSFRIDYFRDLFDNFDFYYSFIYHKSECEMKKWNAYKEKVVERGKYEKEFYEKIRKVYGYKGTIFIYGSGVKANKELLTLSAPKVILEKEEYGRNELYQMALQEEIRANHVILQQRLQELQNEKKMDLYVFGRLKFEIKDAIESYSLKELFIQREKYEKLRSWIDHDAFNFKVYFIEKLESGDVADTWIQNYNGVMGIKYF